MTAFPDERRENEIAEQLANPSTRRDEVPRREAVRESQRRGGGPSCVARVPMPLALGERGGGVGGYDAERAGCGAMTRSLSQSQQVSQGAIADQGSAYMGS